MTILDYLYQAAEKHPDKIAFEDGKMAMTYSEVLKTAQVIGTALNKQLAAIKKPVVVMIDRNVESICAFFGIAMSRNFYVPIDSTQPLQRIQTILGQMQPAAIIAFGNLLPEIADNTKIPVFEYENLIAGQADLDLIASLQEAACDTDPLYAICTSGSTGIPKGVLVSHRSVLDFIPVFCETFGFTEQDVFGNQAPFDFDVSVKDIYSTIYLGATTYIIPKVCFVMPKMLMDKLNEKKVTVITWAVSALCIIAELNIFEYAVPQYIRKVLFSGEVMPMKMLNIWRQYLPDAMYVNLYGPTEITCNCMYYILDREFALTEKLPLGKTFANEEVLILKEGDVPAQIGEEGEICVTGTCLALGYYNDPERTAKAFVQNPLNTMYPECMYRTGDMAQIAEDGQMYFAARKDFQIKHMGHRIELEEIEAHINAIDGILRTSCMFDEEKNKIVAFYVGEHEAKHIITCMRKVVPKYMIPNIFVKKEKLPLNKNGKIDRQKLKTDYLSERE